MTLGLLRRLTRPKSWEECLKDVAAVKKSDLPFGVITEFILRPKETGLSVFAVELEDRPNIIRVAAALSFDSSGAPGGKISLLHLPLSVVETKLQLPVVETLGDTGFPAIDALHREIVLNGHKQCAALAAAFLKATPCPVAGPVARKELLELVAENRPDFPDVLKRRNEEGYGQRWSNIEDMIKRGELQLFPAVAA